MEGRFDHLLEHLYREWMVEEKKPISFLTFGGPLIYFESLRECVTL